MRQVTKLKFAHVHPVLYGIGVRDKTRNFFLGRTSLNISLHIKGKFNLFAHVSYLNQGDYVQFKLFQKCI